jgi:ketosteroid isomerase-like protein
VSDPNEQLLRDWAAAFNSGDIDAALAFVHPEIELADPARTGRSWHGHEGYRAFIEEWLENFDWYTLEAAEIEKGPDGFFVRGVQRGRGRGSGLEFELPIHLAIRFRDGEVSYYRIATDPESARHEVGLD